MKQKIISAIIPAAFVLLHLGSMAGTDNIASYAKVTASSSLNDQFKASNVTDGLIGVENKGEWACEGFTTEWGYVRFPWIQLEWEQPQDIEKIIQFQHQ